MVYRLRNAALGLGLVLGFSASAHAQIYTANLQGQQEAPPVGSSASGYARVMVDSTANTLTFTVVFNNLTSAQILSHIHTGVLGATGPVTIDFGTVGGTSGVITGTRSITAGQIASMRIHGMYVNVHSVNFPNGELRGQLGLARFVDFDGDGRTDANVLQFPTSGSPKPITFWNLGTTAGALAQPWGDADTDFPAPGDYDGDGKDDWALYRRGSGSSQSTFYVLRSSDGGARIVPWGLGTDIICNADYDGDGKTDFCVFRRGTLPTDQAWWYILRSSDGGVSIVPWGTTGDLNTSFDLPVPEDYDADGKADITVYRTGMTPNNTFLIKRSSDGATVYQAWGNFQSDYIVQGDFDGDGKGDYVAARTGASASNPMVWWILQSSDGGVRVQSFGISSDLPTPGDYDGDGKVDISIYRRGATPSSNSFFWVYNSFVNSAISIMWGLQAYFPTATAHAR